ncbi:MAG: hypothetical protein M3422_23195, partial [Actinomycetota bacterium]|nr:hypothetical protein [Actinomycetota bacterium]
TKTTAEDGGATTSAASFSPGGLSGGGGSGGVPWSRLVGATPGPGGLVGGGPPPVQSVLAAESAALSEAAKRAMGPGGFFAPASAARQGDEEHDKRHETRLPNVDNGLFALDERASAPVIGATPERENDIGFQ